MRQKRNRPMAAGYICFLFTSSRDEVHTHIYTQKYSYSIGYKTLSQTFVSYVDQCSRACAITYAGEYG